MPIDAIPIEEAATLPGLFRARVRRTPDGVAYRQYNPADGRWHDRTWHEMAQAVDRWQAGLVREGLQPGDRVAVMLRNCREWVMFEQAALGLGLVVVPLYTEDRAENVAYILQNAGVRLLLLGGAEHWEALRPVQDALGFLRRILVLAPLGPRDPGHPRLMTLDQWLPAQPHDGTAPALEPDALATIVYTSGTTGRPKGVMLSHHNILWNAWASQQLVPLYTDDVLLSFLPLSHTFERTVGYYVPMMCGATVAYNRSIPELAADLAEIRPTLLISVPRIFERVHNRIQEQLTARPAFARRLFEAAVATGWRRFEHRQGRAPAPGPLDRLLWPLLRHLVADKVMQRLGGRLRYAICGGAPLSPRIARFFIGLGLEIIQGYGLTETSPVIAANRPDDNLPASVGRPLADVEVRIGDQDELLVRGPGVMLGYWDDAEATRAMIDDQGWLHTGDKARQDAAGHVFITGRLKEIIVLANGEKVPPADMEMAIAADALFDQVMVIGDGRPYLAALVVLNPEQWQQEARALGIEPGSDQSLCNAQVVGMLLERIGRLTASFPGYAQIRRVACFLEPWTIDNGLITPTLKLRRERVLERFQSVVEALYEGH